MSQDTQVTPAAFREGSATFIAPFGHTLQLDVGADHIAAFVRVDGADARLPLVSVYGYTAARSALINRVPVLIVGHAYLPLPATEHAAAVAFLQAQGAYSHTAGVDA